METPSQVSPENAGGPFSFNVGGESFEFEGGFTEGKFTGMIRGADGKEFAGLVEDLGGGRYKIEDWEGGGTIESPAEALAAVPAETPVGGLEDAAAVAQTPTEEAEVAAEAVIESKTGLVVEEEPTAKAESVEAAAEEVTPEVQAETEPEPVEAGPELSDEELFAGEFDEQLARARNPQDALKVTGRRVEMLKKDASARAARAAELTGRRDKLEEELRLAEQVANLAESDFGGNRKMSRLILQNRKKAEQTRAELANLGQEIGVAEAELSDKETEDTLRMAEISNLNEELAKWRQVIENPGLWKRYQEVSQWKKLLGKGKAISWVQEAIEEANNLEKQLPRRLLELEGVIPEKKPKKVSDKTVAVFEERYVYNRAAGKLHELLKSVAAEPVVETAIEKAPAEEVAPSAEAETGGQAAEVSAPAAAEEEVAPAPIEVPTEAPVEAPVEAPPSVEEVPVVPVEAVEAPLSEEAAAETPEQRFERRKQGFAGALAELDLARGNTSGTEGEQKVRMAEAFNSAIGMAMEFMEEGEAAKGVVREFFAGALGTPGGRKLTEVAVRSRMDEAGIFQAATPDEKKKKLKEVGLWGLLELLIELGMGFVDKSVGAVVSEVQSATGGGR